MATLKDKIILVIGAGRGLGRATALRVAKDGAKVVLVARTADELHKVAQEVKKVGTQAIAIVADVTLERDVARVTSESQKAFGDIDIIVNCAGDSLMRGLPDTTIDDWNRGIAENMTSVFLVMREYLPSMMERKSGQIINVTSRVAMYGSPKASAYGAAKSGAVHFSRVWADEAKKCGVKVVAIAPGPMDTPMRWAASPNMAHERTMNADTIADFIYWIISHPEITFEDAPVPVSLYY